MAQKAICINDNFTPDAKEFYKQFGVTTPVKGKEYTIREVREERGKLGLLLNELINPEVPIKSVTKLLFMEPSWSSSRFSDELGLTLYVENVKEKETHDY